MNQNEHCLIRFMGKNWRIARIRKKIWTLEDETGLRTKMDVSGVRWEEYTEARVRLLWPQ